MYDYTMVWDLIEYIESRLAIENKNDVANNLSSASSPSRESNNVTKDTTTTKLSPGYMPSGLTEQVQKAINAFGKSFVKSILKSEPGKVGVYLGGDGGIRENLERVCQICRKLGISEDST